MKNKILFPIVLIITVVFPGCELIEGVFRAGIWFALIAILIIVALVYLLFSKAIKPEKVTVSTEDAKKK